MLRAVAKNGGVVQANFSTMLWHRRWTIVRPARPRRRIAETAVQARMAELKAAGKPVNYPGMDKDKVERE